MEGSEPPPLALDAVLEASSVEELLPIIRIVRARGNTSHDTDQDVFALYEDRLIAFRSAGKAKVPADAYEPGGHARLTALRHRGPLADLGWQDIAAAWIGGPSFHGRRWFACDEIGRQVRVQAPQGVIEVFLPEDDASAVIIALRRLLGARLMECTSFPQFPNSARHLIAPPQSRQLRWIALGFVLSACATAVAAFSLLGQLFKFGVLTISFLIFGPLGMLVAGVWLLLMTIKALARPDSAYSFKQRMAKRRFKRELQGGCSRRQPFRSPALGLVLKGLGVFTLLGSFVAVVTTSLKWQNWRLAFLPATCLIYYGYRLSLRSALEVRSNDRRPPILYLRSFELDARHDLNPKGTVAQLLGLESPQFFRWLGPLGNAHPVRLIRLLFSRAADHVEEQLGAYFQKHGPFVAFGEPGERLALGGAARLHIAHSNWQDTVRLLIREAAIVVLQPGDSESMWWEIRETFALTDQRNILFLLNFKESQPRYERFRLWLEREINESLPRNPGENAFLFFTATGPRLLPLRQRPQVCWPLAGCAINFDLTLAPFFLNRGCQVEPLSAPPNRLSHFCGAVFGIVVWFLVIAGIYWGGRLTVNFLRHVPEDWQLVEEAERFAEVEETAHDQIAITGPEDMPYKVEIPRLWAESRGTPELADQFTPKPQHLWQLGRCGWMAVSSGQGPVAWRANSRALTDVGLRALRAQMKTVVLRDQRTEMHAGRPWLTTRLRLVGGEEFAKARNAAFLATAEMQSTLRVYAGPEGWVQIQWAGLRQVVEIMEPAFDKVFAGLTLPAPVVPVAPVALDQRDALAKEALTQLHNAETRATYTGGQGAHKYSVALKRPWKQERPGIFRLGAAVMRVDVLPPTEDTASKESAQRELMELNRQRYGPIVNLSETRIRADGKQWIEASYDGLADGTELAILQRLHVCSAGSVILWATVPLELRSEYDAAIREAFAGFHLGSSGTSPAVGEKKP